MFVPERMVSFSMPGVPFRGRVLGNHVLRTEYGEITLRANAFIEAYRNTVFQIFEENFINRRASHNLVVEGVIIPQNVFLGFNVVNREIASLGLRDQEIAISEIPLTARSIFISPHRYIADISFLFLTSGYVTLTDNTQIYFIPLQHGGPMLRRLNMYKDDEIWRITAAGTGRTSVKRPYETEFTEYRSITFRPHWGEFIEGELFE